MPVFAFETPFWGIDTEKTPCFCGTMLERLYRCPPISRKPPSFSGNHCQSPECSRQSQENYRQPQKIQHNPCNFKNHWINLLPLTEKYIMRYSLSLLSLLLWNRHNVWLLRDCALWYLVWYNRASGVSRGLLFLAGGSTGEPTNKPTSQPTNQLTSRPTITKNNI